MATYTATAAQAAVQPKALRVGLTAVKSTFSIDVTLSAGDVFQMVKVPANATPMFVEFGGTNATPSFLMKAGDDISTARYRSLATYSAGVGMVLANANIATVTPPYTYSADNTLDIELSTITASNASSGGAFYMNVIFSMDAT